MNPSCAPMLALALGLALAPAAVAQATEEVQTLLSETQVRELDVAQQQRVEQLRHELSGLLAPGLSDLEVLGIQARSEAERRLYAERFVRRYRALTNAVLDFQQAVWQAHQRLFGDEPLLDPKRWYSQGYRWTLKPGGEADDEQLLRRVLAAARAGQSSHIRLLTQDRDAALQWVRAHLPADLLRAERFVVSLAAEGSEGLQALQGQP